MQTDEQLTGKTIIVTRPLAQAQKMCELLERYQAVVVHFPVISITSVQNADAAKKKFQQLNTYSKVIFISANAVHYAMELAQELGVNFNNSLIAAVGPATTTALNRYGYTVSITPTEEFSSEALLKHESLQNVSGAKVLIVRGRGGREHLYQELESRGATVEYAEVYQRQLPKQRNTIDLSELSSVKTAILIYSAESAQNLWSLCSNKEQQWLKNITLVVGGKRLASIVGTLGFAKNPIIAENPSDEAMLNALIVWANNT